ncbi:MAG: rhomboid family intramembrane serine protease [Bacteroidales bacterium]|jgi:membrane associated rhomboid family serine protease|nr:rhomboid family intramembrane serine protease [Bacteroidales bacterium]
MSGIFGLQNSRLLPPVVKNLLIINVLFFLATILLAPVGVDLVKIFGLHYFSAPDFRPWQLVTYMFMHANFGHIFFNMFALWMFGAALEQVMGQKRFLTYYLITGIGAAILHYLVLYYQLRPYLMMYEMSGNMNALNQFVTIGASGSVFGLLLAFGMLFPNSEIYLYFLLPIKAKWFVIIYGAIELFYGIGGTNDGVAHFAHLGGMLFGFILLMAWKHHDRNRFIC